MSIKSIIKPTFFIFLLLLAFAFCRWSLADTPATDSTGVGTLSTYTLKQLQPTIKTTGCQYFLSDDAIIYGNDPQYKRVDNPTPQCPAGTVAVKNTAGNFLNQWSSVVDYYAGQQRRDVVRSYGVRVGIVCCPIVNTWQNPP